MMTKNCSECQRVFTFEEAFYDKRGFVYPNRCPTCAAKVRGRSSPKTKNRRCALYVPKAEIILPDNCIHNASYLKRQDVVTKRDYFSCLKFSIYPKVTIFPEPLNVAHSPKGKTGHITVYDQRNSDPDNPHSVDMASLRIMVVDEPGKESYTYIVFDFPEGVNSNVRFQIEQTEQEDPVCQECCLWHHTWKMGENCRLHLVVRDEK